MKRNKKIICRPFYLKENYENTVNIFLSINEDYKILGLKCDELLSINKIDKNYCKKLIKIIKVLYRICYKYNIVSEYNEFIKVSCLIYDYQKILKKYKNKNK